MGVAQVWADVSGNSRDGQAVSLATPATQFTSECWLSDCDVTLSGLRAEEEAWLSLEVTGGKSPYGTFNFKVG